MQHVGIDKASEQRTVVPIAHVNESVVVGHHAVAAVVQERCVDIARVIQKLAVGIILERIDNDTSAVGNGNRAAAAVVVVSLERTVGFVAAS